MKGKIFREFFTKENPLRDWVEDFKLDDSFAIFCTDKSLNILKLPYGPILVKDAMEVLGIALTPVDIKKIGGNWYINEMKK
jgi:hypothetical protein